MSDRFGQELALLEAQFSSVTYKFEGGLHWYLVTGVRMPDDWMPIEINSAFSLTAAYPAAEPYGFYVPAELKFKGAPPSEHPPPHPPPFPGEWRFLSWSPVNWKPGSTTQNGSNTWDWVRTFAHRLREGI